MTDAELLTATSVARAAHRAPMAIWSMDHQGHSSINNHTSGYAFRGNDFMALADECEKRGLKLPQCDCPAGAHDWEKTSKGSRHA